MPRGNGEREAKEFDAEAIAAKPMSALQEHLLAWIIEQTGVEFATKKEKDAFALGVKYTVNFRTYHQASPENQARLAAAAAAKADEDEAPKPAPAKKAAKAAPAPAKKAPAKKAAPVEAEEAPAKPSKKKKASGVAKATDAPF